MSHPFQPGRRKPQAPIGRWHTGPSQHHSHIYTAAAMLANASTLALRRPWPGLSPCCSIVSLAIPMI